MSINAEQKATLLVALSATLYGCLGYLGIQLLRLDFSIPAMLFWRFFIATLWMSFSVIKNFKKDKIKTHKRSDLIKAFLLGAICYGLGAAFYFLTSEITGTGLAMVLFFTYPMFVVVLTWLFDKHAISKPVMISLAIILVGLILLKGDGGVAISKLGILFAFIAALTYALYIYGNRHLASTVPTHYLTILVCAASALIFFIISVTMHQFKWPTTGLAWIYILAIGIFATALPIQLLLEGLKHINPTKVAIISVLEPVVTLLVGITLLHETASIMQLVGAAVILLGAICIQLEK